MNKSRAAVHASVDRIVPWLDPPPLDGGRAKIAAAAMDVIRETRRSLGNPQRPWLEASCASALALFRSIERQGGADAAAKSLGEALASSASRETASYLEARLGIDLRDPRTAFDRIVENFVPRGQDRFGPMFRYAEEVRGPDVFTARIESCYFDRFFRLHGTPFLCPLFCRLDTIWTDALERFCPDLQFSRPTTLADGHDACRFRFARLHSERS